MLQLQLGVAVAHPGVTNDFNDESAKKYYTYYQWVCFVLFFQVRTSINFNFLLICAFGLGVSPSETGNFMRAISCPRSKSLIAGLVDKSENAETETGCTHKY